MISHVARFLQKHGVNMNLMDFFFALQVSTFSQVVSQKVDAAKDAAGNIRVPGLNRGKCFTLLVIDDANTDW